MKNRIYIFCIVSVIVTGKLYACGDECNPERPAWCDGDKLMYCVWSEMWKHYYVLDYNNKICDPGKCVEYQWPGKTQTAACLISDQLCPEEGFQNICDGYMQLTCTPDRGIIHQSSCVDWATYNDYWNENDPLVGMAPTCVVSGPDHQTSCALSTESCNDGDSKCMMTATSDRSVPVYCSDGFWTKSKYYCYGEQTIEDFHPTCAYSSELKSFTCAFSTEECKDQETKCVVSPESGRKALLICKDALWTDGVYCKECATQPDGSHTCT